MLARKMREVCAAPADVHRSRLPLSVVMGRSGREVDDRVGGTTSCLSRGRLSSLLTRPSVELTAWGASPSVERRVCRLVDAHVREPREDDGGGRRGEQSYPPGDFPDPAQAVVPGQLRRGVP